MKGYVFLNEAKRVLQATSKECALKDKTWTLIKEFETTSSDAVARTAEFVDANGKLCRFNTYVHDILATNIQFNLALLSIGYEDLL